MKLTAFRIGVLSGLALSLCAILGVYLAFRSLDRPHYTFEGTTAGADLTRHGAKTVDINTTYGLLARQTCNGACDDLTYKLRSGDNGVAIEVRDAAGKCLTCDKGLYVTSGFAASIHVGGKDKLEVTRGYGENRADSSGAPEPSSAQP